MEQGARTRALSAFKSGEVRALVATDVAARGIDVQDIARVVQIDAPNDADTYTHRSGRTGRAGRKGVSTLIVAPQALRRTLLLLERARVRAKIQPVPSADAIRAWQDQCFLAELGQSQSSEPSPRVRAQIARIIEGGLTERALALLLGRAEQTMGQPRDITPVTLGDRRPRTDRNASPKGQWRAAPPHRQQRDTSPSGPRRETPANFQRHDASPWAQQRDASPNFQRREASPNGQRDDAGWVPFRVTWGEAHGADPRRLVAMLCRRGQIKSQEIGAIRVAPTSSVVEVAASVAARFAAATRKPDSRDRRVVVTPL
jgi:ATP-dependent RNA helicase DeaD